MTTTLQYLEQAADKIRRLATQALLSRSLLTSASVQVTLNGEPDELGNDIDRLRLCMQQALEAIQYVDSELFALVRKAEALERHERLHAIAKDNAVHRTVQGWDIADTSHD